MKLHLWHVFGLVGLLGAAGCGTLDVATTSNPHRVVTGTIRGDVPLPAGAEVLVRVVDTPNRPAVRPNSDLPVPDRAAPPIPERVLGQQAQTLPAATHEPVPFRVEFEADDATLRRGLNIDVRVSSGPRVRFRTVRAHVLTLAASPYPQEVLVESVD